MASAKEIKRKISSIKNTGKITKAMELISTVKMKKASDIALSKREFVLEMLKVFLRVEEYLEDFPLFHEGAGEKTLAIMVTSNKGLCGGYNINVMKKVNNYIQATGEELEFITIGKKAANFAARTGQNIIADFSNEFTDYIEPVFTKSISQMAREEFLKGKYKKVVVFYNYYVNTIKQVAVAKISLPVSAEDIKKYLMETVEDHFDLEKELEMTVTKYHLEPEPEILVGEVIPIILDMIFHGLLLEAKASEHSARMVAMKAAKDNAANIASNLTLRYNKARQAMITTEVSEITAGVESIKEV
jgi:F-type H+-transporting ATPase subunit gamma